MRRIIPELMICAVCMVSCNTTGWTDEELSLIRGGGNSVMRVLSVDKQDDSLALRRTSCDIGVCDLQGKDYKILADRLVRTLKDCDEGVGLAGPQVGIARKIVVVQRFDKDGEPFEVYPNIRITAMRGDTEPGPEGCLSVPERSGYVQRSQDIDIQYYSIKDGKDTTETVKGFTAVIFQHECDHLDGILYIDKLCEEPEEDQLKQ